MKDDRLHTIALILGVTVVVTLVMELAFEWIMSQ
jgi:hypothetical protein